MWHVLEVSMSADHTLMVSLTIYKVVTIFAGLAFAFMGYKLFIHGIFKDAGELRTNWENRKLVLRKAAPGTFFALFGTLIVCTSLWRGLALESSQEAGLGGSGMFGDLGDQASARDDRSVQSPAAEEARRAALNDVATFNQLGNELLRQPQQDETSSLTLTIEDRDQILDLMDRSKAALMLSVWSQAWGDRDEFRQWAQGAPGYFHSYPPAGIARAAAIFKGEAP